MTTTDPLEIQFLEQCGYEVDRTSSSPSFCIGEQNLICSKLLLPSYLHIVLKISQNYFYQHKVHVDIEKSHGNHYALTLYCTAANGIEKVGTVTGRGPSALNLAYIRAVAAITEYDKHSLVPA